MVIVKDGKMMRRRMRQEFITTEELHAELRKQGIDDIGKVKMARMEADGEISVVRNETPRAVPSRVRPGKTPGA